MSEPVDYHCEGCGIHVYAFGIARRPISQFCALCEWLCEHVPDPDEMHALRVAGGHLDPTPRPRQKLYSDCPDGGPPACKGCPGCRGIADAMEPHHGS